MLIATVTTKVDRKNHLEFEQTIIALLKEIEKSKECLGWHLFKEIKNGDAYCIETRWEKIEAIEQQLRSKRFKILTGAIHNLCEPPVGELRISRTLEEKPI